MKFVSMSELLPDARRKGYAIPSFCVWSADSLLSVLETAEDLRAPVMVMTGAPELAPLPPELFAPIAKTVAKRFKIPASLLLDHGDSPELAMRAIRAGYTSIMLDYSARGFDENANALRDIVSFAHAKGVAVEGEIGHVGKADAETAEGAGDSTLTRPEEAARFERITGVDVLAVSIGNAHGHYGKLPNFDFKRLEGIAELVKIPLALHGGSGTPEASLKRAISLGMAKINVASELVAAWRESLRSQWGAGRNLWAPLALAEARKAISPVVAKWIELTGAKGRS